MSANNLLPGTVQTVSTTRGIGFDADAPVSAQTAAVALAENYLFCIRYLPRDAGDFHSLSKLTNSEAKEILNAGLALMVVQHPNAAGWDGTLGNSNGSYAASYAENIGIPAWVNIWCDLESVGSTSPTDIIAYCNAWYEAVAAAGYEPGLYVGANCGLSGQQPYEDLKFEHYRRALSTSVPIVASKGYQLLQQMPKSGNLNDPDKINGLGVDIDFMQPDELGGSMIWLKV